mmetsp:Transcript_27972/g.80288  ORF Transcript_27972/g.80288 Transcript_27972/m.80288 type:complete len:245 (-) Transcript_27972:496-1230(-)
MVRTTLGAFNATSPNSSSMHCGAAGLQVKVERSPTLIVMAANSKASQTSPSPTGNCSVFGPVKPYNASMPSVADSTNNFTLLPSGTTSPSPLRKTFLMSDLSCKRETSRDSKTRSNSNSNFALMNRLSDGTASRVKATEQRSPSTIDISAATTMRDSGPKIGSPTTCSKCSWSSKMLPFRSVHFKVSTTSWPRSGLLSPTPGVSTLFTAQPSPNKSVCVTQPSISTSKSIVAPGGISGGEPKSS